MWTEAELLSGECDDCGEDLADCLCPFGDDEVDEVCDGCGESIDDCDCD